MNKELKSWEKGFKSSTVKEIADAIQPAMIAKKDFVIHFNEIHIEIKAGDDVSKTVPVMFLENLKTEQVI